MARGQSLVSAYDIIVLGTGPAGYVAAIRGAQAGFKVALLGASDLGGTCLNRGCIPTKSMLHISAIYNELIHGEDLGIFAKEPTYNLAKMHKKKDNYVCCLKDGIKGLLKSNKVDVFEGFGTIIANGKVRINNENLEISGKNIIIATGATPAIPPILGVNLPEVLTSTDMLETVPKDIKHLVIIGGGVIGVEMASVYANLGVKVSIIEAESRLLSLLDRDISMALQRDFKQKGVEIFVNAKVTKFTKENEKFIVHFEDKTGEHNVEACASLLSVGRKANINNLTTEHITLEIDKGGIVVNDNFRTNLSNIYAIGDCVSGNIQLAHVASANATNVVEIIAGKTPHVDLSIVPSCIYTATEIATVGLTLDAAKAKGHKAKTSKYLMASNGKSMLSGMGGFVKLIYDEDSLKLLGAQLFCGRASDIISEIAVAIKAELKIEDLASIIHPHPSFAEGVVEAAENIFGKAVHVAK